MSTTEDGTGARAKTPTRQGNLAIHHSPPARSLRNRPPVDYKRMNEGAYPQYSGDDFDSQAGGDLYDDADREQRSFGGNYDRNPWGASEPGYHDVPFSLEDGAEISSLKQQLAHLSEVEAFLKKQTEADDLRRQVAEKKKSIAALRGNTKPRSHSKVPKTKEKSRVSEPTKLPSKSDDVNILTLRKSKKLRSKVKKELKNTGLIDSDECRSLSSDESVGSDTSVQSDSKTRGSSKKGTSKSKPKKNKQSDSSVESPENISKRKTKSISKRKQKKNKQSDSSSESPDSISFSSSESDSDEKKKRKKKIKSGMKAKASDSVRKSQRYPQAHLRFEFVSSNISFEKLDINLFLAGEIEIISDKRTKESEKIGQVRLVEEDNVLEHCYEMDKTSIFMFEILEPGGSALGKYSI